MINKLKIFFSSLLLTTYIPLCWADPDPLTIFPLDNYDQTLSTWINPNDKDYDKLLLSKDMQQKYQEIYFQRYFGNLSPWSADYINQIIHHAAPDDIKTNELALIATYDNKVLPAAKMGYGENFRLYGPEWINQIRNNININQFDQLSYNANNRAIALTNLHARVLPTEEVFLFNYKLPGEGFPFDYLDMSALWAGTPIYILGETADHAWDLVVTPEYKIAWVKANGIARVNAAFIDNWSKAAKKHLIAITRTETSILDSNANNAFKFSAYIGSVFPGEAKGDSFKVMIPVANAQQNAVIHTAIVSGQDAVLTPLAPTPHNFGLVMNTLLGRNYGWGNIYFYNDCSAELKSLFTPFSVWLPRHSSEQVKVGKMVDMGAASAPDRLSYLIKNGHKLVTLLYTGGHVILFAGNYTNPKTQEPMAMTYQNMWGLAPNPPTRRAVIGKSVFFPMLLQYPEDTTLNTQANKKFFQVSYLDEASANDLKRMEVINLKEMMAP